MKVRVYYEDTDTGGVVYHSNYLNFCERARSDAFFEKGQSPLLKSGHFVARKLEADFFSSAKLGDELYIETSLMEIKAASFNLKQMIFKDDEKIFELKIKLAYITFEGKPQKMTEDVISMIKSLFSS